METHKGPYKDYSPSKGDYMGFHVKFGGVYLRPVTNCLWLIRSNIQSPVHMKSSWSTYLPFTFDNVYIENLDRI